MNNVAYCHMPKLGDRAAASLTKKQNWSRDRRSTKLYSPEDGDTTLEIGGKFLRLTKFRKE